MNRTELLERLTDIEWDDFEVKEARFELSKSIWELRLSSFFSILREVGLCLGIALHKEGFEVMGVEKAEKIEQEFVSTLRSNLNSRAFDIYFGLLNSI